MLHLEDDSSEYECTLLSGEQFKDPDFSLPSHTACSVTRTCSELTAPESPLCLLPGLRGHVSLGRCHYFWMRPQDGSHKPPAGLGLCSTAEGPLSSAPLGQPQRPPTTIQKWGELAAQAGGKLVRTGCEHTNYSRHIVLGHSSQTGTVF